MASVMEARKDLPEQRNEPARGTSAPEAALKARLSRKRTKTGCLTCRKRRVKCDEERPTCKNCIKSRRSCEGYNHSAPIRIPQVELRYMQNGAATIVFQSDATNSEGIMADGGDYSDSPGQRVPQLRPRRLLPIQHANTVQNGQQQFQTFYEQAVPYGHVWAQSSLYSDPNSRSQSPWISAPQLPPVIPAKVTKNHTHHLHGHTDGHSNVERFSYPPNTSAQRRPNPTPYTPQAHSVNVEPTRRVSGARDRWQATKNVQPSHTQSQFQARPFPPYQQSFLQQDSSVEQAHTDAQQAAWHLSSYVPSQELVQPVDQPTTYHEQQRAQPGVAVYDQETSIDHTSHPQTTTTPWDALSSPLKVEYHSPTQVLNGAAVEAQDDEYYDVNTDDELDLDATDAPTSFGHKNDPYSALVALQNLAIDHSSSRMTNAFTIPAEEALYFYQPERVANPLKNPLTARVFVHFMTSTGPMISGFEKHRKDGNFNIIDSSVPISQQGLMTHAVPLVALHHQGLLQAVLAIASLHIAHLTGASTTPSLKHYAYAIKRIHHCVSHAEKRNSVPVMAASQLLGFYEIMCADHVKWNSHLAGAKQLIVENGFASMTAEFRRLKSDLAYRDRIQGMQQHRAGGSLGQPQRQNTQDALLDELTDANSEMVSLLAGKKLNYDHKGRIIEEMETHHRPYLGKGPLDLAEFGVLSDLFWWYCKQDVYQAIVSGNPLLMDYNRWTDCPPRAPLGKADAVYGSYDHLMLLLGRITTFVAKDRKRKTKVVKANGGHWRPAPGMQMGPPPGAGGPPPKESKPSVHGPSSNAGPGQAPAPGPPRLPPFYGMTPPSTTTMPASYQTIPGHDNQRQTASGPASPSGPRELDVATTQAIEEWNQILAATHVFRSMLGNDFDPLSHTSHPPLQTPFGPAVFYRTYDIACLWTFYYLTLIIVHRSHPHMPPHAYMAVGIAAHQTSQLAHEIGRIAAGILVPPAPAPLDPHIGASMCETSMPLFLAAVQLGHPAQRDWVVSRLFDTERRCGWATAGLIANGCQEAWIRAAEAGKGPPWERRFNTREQEERVLAREEELEIQRTGKVGEASRMVISSDQARLVGASGIWGLRRKKSSREGVYHVDSDG